MPSLMVHGLVVLAGASVTVVTGLWFSRYWNRRLDGYSHGGGLSSYVTVIGTLYAVLLAFVLLSVWEQFDTAQNAAEREASQLSNLARLSAALPEPGAGRLRESMREYARAVSDEEWQRMRFGGHSPRADRALAALWESLIAIDPAPGRAASVYEQALDCLRNVANSRQDRLSQARPSVRAVIWILLIGGGVLSLVAICLFEVAPKVYLPVNVGLTLMIAFILYLIFAFDHPFSYDVGTGHEAMRAVLEMLG